MGTVLLSAGNSCNVEESAQSSEYNRQCLLVQSSFENIH